MKGGDTFGVNDLLTTAFTRRSVTQTAATDTLLSRCYPLLSFHYFKSRKVREDEEDSHKKDDYHTNC